MIVYLNHSHDKFDDKCVSHIQSLTGVVRIKKKLFNDTINVSPRDSTVKNFQGDYNRCVTFFYFILGNSGIVIFYFVNSTLKSVGNYYPCLILIEIYSVY